MPTKESLSFSLQTFSHSNRIHCSQLHVSLPKSDQPSSNSFSPYSFPCDENLSSVRNSSIKYLYVFLSPFFLAPRCSSAKEEAEIKMDARKSGDCVSF
mmetsp:Transcript_18218/g.36940  ORF Transcript_18218/g.36940 Transcript_18218/m.36940 type:complete len:98 (+) Transcript_18218:822-1115(+)